ncbi:hypothetical protein EV356DRAFT_370038 [Viridothelium virens]|uniref:Uncharacterized protein n=1 Tax=Viridothelium virens TaxID=1048519 RepID=A0A6A6GVN0_VIRVR|nr:hypothetical protein EV356DRAFT_370038 [Viridothelium virens]
MTRKGVFISLIYDIPLSTNYILHQDNYPQVPSDEDFLARTYRIIRFGNQACRGTSYGIEQLRGRGRVFSEHTQPVHIYIVTPRPTILFPDIDDAYQRLISLLRDKLTSLFPHVREVDIIQYLDDTRRVGTSRIAIEIDTHEGDFEEHSSSVRPEYGAWRMWVGQLPKAEGTFLQDI